MTATVEDLTRDEYFAPDDDDEFLPPEPDEPAPAAGPDLSPDADAPYGYTMDHGVRRPKLRPGRRGGQAPQDAAALAAAPPVTAEPDKPPAPARSRARRILAPPPPAAPAAPPADVPMPKGGTIAKGVDKLYRRAGKIVRAWNYELGSAFIEAAKPDPDDEDSVTVGQAWENLARDNPRIRAWLLRLMHGGDWQELVWAHLPIGLAIVTSTWVGRILPLGRLAESWLEPDDDDQPEGEGGAAEDSAPPAAAPLLPEDADAMMRTAQENAQRIARKMGVKVPANVAAAAMREAQQHAQRMGIPGAGAPITPPYENRDLEPGETDGITANGHGPAVAVRRAQPKHSTRSQRRR